MADSREGVTFSAINTAFGFSDLCVRTDEIDEESAIFARTIQRVRCDLEEAERLLRTPSVKAALDEAPERRKWIDGVIFSTRTCLNEIELYAERARTRKAGDGTASFTSGGAWGMSQHEKLEIRRLELLSCQQSLMRVIYTLDGVRQAEDVAAKAMPENVGPPSYEAAVFDCAILTSPYTRRKKFKDKAATRAQQGQGHGHEGGNLLATSEAFKWSGDQKTAPAPDVPIFSKAQLDSLVAEKTSHRQSLSGTNNFGPLNQWEMFHELDGQARMISTPRGVELPTNDRSANYTARATPLPQTPMNNFSLAEMHGTSLQELEGSSPGPFFELPGDAQPTGPSRATLAPQPAPFSPSHPFATTQHQQQQQQQQYIGYPFGPPPRPPPAR